MLIYTSKNPGWGKKKPDQYGPESLVRSSVFRNAERMGIDPSGWEVVAPMWESAGLPRNVITGRSISRNGTTSWVPGGMFAAQDSGYLDFSQEITPRGVNLHHIFSAMLVADPVLAQASTVEVLMGFGSGSSTQYTVVQSYSANNRYVPVSSGAGGTFTTLFQRPDAFIIQGTDTVNQAQGFVYKQGAELLTGTVSVSSGLEWGTFTVGRASEPTSAYDAEIACIKMVLFHRDNWTDTQRQQLAETPYALLQRNPTPLVFYVAAGGSVTETLTDTLFSEYALTDKQSYLDTISSVGNFSDVLTVIQNYKESLASVVSQTSSETDVQSYIDVVLDTLEYIDSVVEDGDAVLFSDVYTWFDSILDLQFNSSEILQSTVQYTDTMVVRYNSLSVVARKKAFELGIGIEI